MIVRCETCKRNYDDAECWTICPHGPLWANPGAYCREHDLVDCFICKEKKESSVLSNRRKNEID